MLHLVLSATPSSVIRSLSPASPHFPDQFPPAGGENLPLVRRSPLFHQPCALYLPGQSAPSCLWMLPSRSCEYDTIFRPGSRRVRRSELHSQPKRERPSPPPPPAPGPHRVHGSGPEWVSISKHVAVSNAIRLFFRAGGWRGEGRGDEITCCRLLLETLRTTMPRLIGPR